MNNNINPTLKKALEGNYRFNFENYISRGFDITGKFSGAFMGYTFIYFILLSVVAMIPTIGEYISTLFVAPALTVGYYLVARRISMNEDHDFENFFDGFKEIVPLVLVALAPFIFTSLIPLAMSYIFSNDIFAWTQTLVDDPTSFDLTTILTSLSFGFFIYFIPVIYFTVAWAFAPMFVIFYKMEPWEALETSRKLITKKWFSFFGFMIVQGLIALLGMLLICVGVLYFLPAAMNASYVAFEDITKFYEENEEDDILDHLVEN